MPKGDKYLELTRYLEASHQTEITLTFEQIERILSGKIPASVKRQPNQLVPSASYAFAYGWKNAGYVLVASDLAKQTITLRKQPSKTPPSGAE